MAVSAGGGERGKYQERGGKKSCIIIHKPSRETIALSICEFKLSPLGGSLQLLTQAPASIIYRFV